MKKKSSVTKNSIIYLRSTLEPFLKHQWPWDPGFLPSAFFSNTTFISREGIIGQINAEGFISILTHKNGNRGGSDSTHELPIYGLLVFKMFSSATQVDDFLIIGQLPR